MPSHQQSPCWLNCDWNFAEIILYSLHITLQLWNKPTFAKIFVMLPLDFASILVSGICWIKPGHLISDIWLYTEICCSFQSTWKKFLINSTLIFLTKYFPFIFRWVPPKAAPKGGVRNNLAQAAGVVMRNSVISQNSVTGRIESSIISEETGFNGDSGKLPYIILFVVCCCPCSGLFTFFL